VVRDGATFDADALRQHCAARLPAHAVPREIQVWPSFPTTATSKIDRRSVRIGLATTQPEDDVS
jgi:long-chain acyl-CoA synthetase